MKLHCGNCRAQMRVNEIKGWKFHLFFVCPDDNCTKPQTAIVQLDNYEEVQHIEVESN